MNILVAGRTGCGKSAFVNYLYGAPVRRTGAGRPVTERGVFCEQFTLPCGVILNVHDTWGLEPDRTADWEDLILSEVHKHDRGGAADWFHTVFYCFSAAGARVEDFECVILGKLKQAGCRVLIVFTHADAPNAQRAICAMQQVLLQRCDLRESDMFSVCSVEKTLLTGQKTEPFGRERILTALTDGLWDTLREKFTANLHLQAAAQVERWYALGEELIERQVKFFNAFSPKTAQMLSEEINRTAQGVMNEMQALASDGLAACLDAYGQLMEIYGRPGVRVLAPALGTHEPFSCALTTERRSAYLFCTTLLALIPLYNLTVPAKAARLRRREFRMELMRRKLNMHEQLRLYIEDIARMLRTLQVRQE